jgi:hypothetical protein
MKPCAESVASKFNGRIVEDTDGRVQVMFKFDNGHGASVLWYSYEVPEVDLAGGSYGHELGTWELAHVRYGNNNDWDISYEHFSDVIGYLTDAEVHKYLRKIKKL